MRVHSGHLCAGQLEDPAVAQSKKNEVTGQEEPSIQHPAEGKGLEVPWRVAGVSLCGTPKKLETWGAMSRGDSSSGAPAPELGGCCCLEATRLPVGRFLHRWPVGCDSVLRG